MADLMREKREALARKLAQQHPQVEEFEAAGGDVEDLSGDVDTVGPVQVASSLIGGETPMQAQQTYKDESKRLIDIEDKAEESRRSRFNTDLDDPMFVERILKMESMGELRLSPERKKGFSDAAKAWADLGDARFKRYKIGTDAHDLAEEFFSDKTKPYREEGGE